MCVRLEIYSPSIILVQLPFCDIIEARQTDTRDTHALHKLIPRQFKLCNWCVCAYEINSPTIKVVRVVIFAPMCTLTLRNPETVFGLFPSMGWRCQQTLHQEPIWLHQWACLISLLLRFFWSLLVWWAIILPKASSLPFSFRLAVS